MQAGVFLRRAISRGEKMELASRIWSFADGAIEDFKGPYEEFRAAGEKVA